jgi:DNA-binding LacI/PurR family transcriptional regulator
MSSRELGRPIGISHFVSRAFAPNSRISPDLRERVLKSARRLDYPSNAIARCCRPSGPISLASWSDMRKPFFPGLIDKLLQGLQHNGLQGCSTPSVTRPACFRTGSSAQ